MESYPRSLCAVSDAPRAGTVVYSIDSNARLWGATLLLDASCFDFWLRCGILHRQAPSPALQKWSKVKVNVLGKVSKQATPPPPPRPRPTPLYISSHHGRVTATSRSPKTTLCQPPWVFRKLQTNIAASAYPLRDTLVKNTLWLTYHKESGEIPMRRRRTLPFWIPLLTRALQSAAAAM